MDIKKYKCIICSSEPTKEFDESGLFIGMTCTHCERKTFVVKR